MAAMSRGERPAAKPQLRVSKRVKGGTASSKKHTFESFAQRIAKLKIEPVRRGRSTIIDDAELDATFSYFKDALAEWRDINLSETFSTFARRVAPLCDSLPQVLHHDERIFGLLIENIEKGDKNSEEPLLRLLANFAHDLGARFEKHFEQAVRTVAHLAATHADVEVIEWSFTCLAWLFKYLSRLLVPDLRPVFDLMTPLLGKARQKLFVMRFAAESLSFLVRKAGAAYHRDQSSLRNIIRHISELLKDAQGTTQDIDFQQGLMTLFADSIKGLQRGLHSSAVAIIRELLLQTYDEGYADLQSLPLEFVLKGVITAIIHHSDADNFEPVLGAIIETIKSAASDQRYLGVSSRLLFVVCGVRKGSRVAQWPPVLDTISLLVSSAYESPATATSNIQDLLSALSVVFQYCSIDAAIPHTQILEKLSKEPLEKYFLSFCNAFAELGSERFNTLLLSYFKRFVAQKAQNHGDELCVILPSLYEHNILPKASLQVPSAWQNAMSDRLQQLTATHNVSDEAQRILYEGNAFLDAFGSLVISPEQKQNISQNLYEVMTKSLTDGREKLTAETQTFALGNGFQYLVCDDNHKQSLLQLWPLLAASTDGGNITFWKALLSLAENNAATLDFSGDHAVRLKQGLLRCLGSPSHELRLVALGLTEILASDTEERRQAVATASIIEQTPVNLETQRSISMRIGQLAKLYSNVASDEYLGEAIPTYLFGLLHVRLASVWDDVCSALKVICETKEGESYVLRIAFEWISHSAGNAEAPVTPTETPAPPRYVSHFECTNVMQVEHTIGKSQAMLDDVESQLQARFERDHASVPFLNDFSRTQALRVLNGLPAVAEKRSRVLVPVLLDWGSAQRTTDMPDDDDANGQAPEQESRWTRRDQKSMLTLFSKFTNPKVLYRATDVYKALLALLGNGDADVQRAALKALLSWKEPGIVEYQENLFNLLDDSRFRDEVSVFLDAGSDQSAIKEHHRDVLLPVLLRLLYGKVISGKRGLDVKRRAIFQALTRFDDHAIKQFLGIALGPLNGIHVLKDGVLDESVLQSDLLAPRKQVGMINMVEDMLSALKTSTRPFVASLVDPILYCLINASRALMGSNVAEETSTSSQSSVFRAIRQRSLHALNILFESHPEFSWASYATIIVGELVTPRIQQFPIETAQSISGLLRLFSAWSKSAATAGFLVEFDRDILVKVAECLNVPSAQDDVKRFVLDSILRELISLVAKDEKESTETKIKRNSIQSNIIQPYANDILVHVGALLRKSPSRDVLESGVHTVAELAPHVVGSSESRNMIEISSFLLRQPSQRVNAATKTGLLKILHEFIPRCQSTDMAELFDTVFEGVCPLFSYIKDRNARALLCDVIQDLSSYRDDLSDIAKLCHGLNSYSESRLDEPDFDRRSAAFGEIIESHSFSILQWQPLLQNMLFYIKDDAELSIRVNASLSLRHFIKISVQSQESKDFIAAAILPGIRFGVREPSELVRVEFLAVLAQLIETYRDWNPVADLHVLLSADEEASFFNNVLHIQSHRRLRALRRLASDASQLHSGNIYHILIPLLEHFVFNKADDDAANALSGETVRTITALCLGLEWPQFRSLLKRYIGYLSSKEDMQKTIVKLLSGLLDSLNQAGRLKGYVASVLPDAQGQKIPADAAVDSTEANAMEVDEQIWALAKTLPQQEKLTKDIVDNILADLQKFLSKKEESTVSLRVPVAIAVCKALLILPSSEVDTRLPAVLLDICHILRSKDQGSRDMARNTLAEIAAFTGPTYIGFILRALRIALSRGYQLHVLSFTVHKILTQISEQLQPGDIDYCIVDIVDVIMDDIFGVTGQEKDAEEYISKMKEVKSSKSFDSMDLIARSTTPGHLVELVLPIKSLLQEKLNARTVQKIDELLRRIGLGALQNPTVNNRDILMFSYELIQEVYKSNNSTERVEHVDPRNRKFLINMKGAAKSGARQSTASYSHKLIRFGLDILRTVLRKHEELQTPQNLSGFLPIIGDALISSHEELQTSAIRLLSTIIKVPMKDLDDNCPVYVTEAVRSIKGATSSNSEIAQASLKLITSMLRERPNVQIREQDLAHLLKRILPDIDEPDRQGVTFGFLKAVMQRKIVIAEVYEVMDKVAEMMITNQTQSARVIARSTYFTFLIEFPQAKNRFKKQVEFLLKNLRYDHVEGRQSVMEALSLILNKVNDTVLSEHLGMMFIPLVHSMANDDSADCRTMAGALVKAVFERASSQHLKSFTGDLKEWLTQDEDVGLKRLGIQCWGLYLEVADAKPKEVEFVMEQLRSTLDVCLERRDDEDWELIYYTLTVFSKLTKPWPQYTLSPNSMWDSIRSAVSYPHAWVRLTAAKLIGTFFADLSVANSGSGLETVPLEGSHGLQLTEEAMIQLSHAFLRNLEAPGPSEELCIQSVRNLAFLARCFAANEAKWNWKKVDDDEDVEDGIVTEEVSGTEETNEDVSGEEWGGFSPPPESQPKKTAIPTAIHRLVTRLSGIIRRETKIMKLSSLYPKSATATLLETIMTKLPIDALESSLPHLLTTLSTLTDPATTIPRSTESAFNDTYRAIIDKSREIMNTLQKRMGSHAFLKVMGDVQKGVKQRREERRQKRKIEAVTMPERFGKEKKRRNDIKKVKRKEKSAEYRGKRRGW